MKKIILIWVICCFSGVQFSSAQDYSDMLVGSWKATEMEIGGEVYTLSELDLDVFMTFNEDGTASFKSGDEEEEHGKWALDEKTIYDPEYPDEERMTIMAITQNTLELIYEDKANEELDGTSLISSVLTWTMEQ